jgi:SAM-dependent methyltransferase
MNAFDRNRPAEERIQQAIIEGPDMEAPGRFGASRFVRRLVGRAVKFERDFNLQIDVALLDRIHEIEEFAARQVREAEIRLSTTDDHLRYADEVLREADQQVREVNYCLQRDVSGLAERCNALEATVDELQSRLHDAETRAAVANAIAAGAADGFVSLNQRVSRMSSEATFVYDEMTAMPFVADEAAVRYTDAHGRKRLGYQGVVGALPLYAGFEEIFRGSEALIRDRQRVYLDVIGDRGPVVDLGCGRGEMLGLLGAAGIDARGVDLDETMVDRARAGGADVHHGDALDFLMKQEDASLGAIFSAQFIEHLPATRLPELLEIARAKLRPEGVFIAETVNPHSPRALKAFWVDPTNQHPLFPESMLALCRFTGFEAAEIMFPLGTDDLATDLRTCGEYAVVAGAVERR